MEKITEILLVVTLIIGFQNGKPAETATGFLYSKNDSVYLITNRHVVLNEREGIRADSLLIRLHTDPHDLTKNENMIVHLYRNGSPTWHQHPRYDSDSVDIVAIEVPQNLLRSRFFFKTLSSQAFPPPDRWIGVGDAMIIGYPRGFSDAVNNLPIARNGLLASQYGLKFDGLPLCLVDANLHPGMSGSPVFAKQSNIWRSGPSRTLAIGRGDNTYFLGVFSATVSTILSDSTQEPLGLGFVWYGNLIEDIIDSALKP